MFYLFIYFLLLQTWKEGWKKIWKPGKKQIWKPAWKQIWKPHWIETKKAVWKDIQVFSLFPKEKI